MNATVSTKRNRTYPHKFDWDEARRRHRAGESINGIARTLGVSPGAIKRVVDPVDNARRKLNLQLHLATRARCTDCGKPCSNQSNRPDPRCKPCANIKKRREHWNADGLLHCARCNQWKHPTLYAYDAKAHTRDYYRKHCRTCDSELRRETRNRRRVPCTNCGQPRSHPNERGNRWQDTGLCLACYRDSIALSDKTR